MKVLSLFDGISCGRVALDRAKIPVKKYYAYEIEPAAIKISKNNFPDIVQCGDVTKENFEKFYGVDILMGGSPCQSLSIVQSKTRKNLDGKSKLFFEFERALKEAAPTWFLFENVASMNEESRAVISDCLGCEPILIDSNCFSAQDRPRLYWTNIPVQIEGLRECNLCLRDILESEVDEKYFYNYPLSNIDLTKQVCATMEHNNHEMHKRIFNPDFKCHTLTAVCGGNQQKKIYINGRARKLTPLEYERLQTLPDNYTAGVADGPRYKSIGNCWTVDVIAFILSFIPTEHWE